MRAFRLLIILLIALGPVSLAQASPWRHQELLAADAKISLDEAVRRVQAATGGRVVSAAPARRGDREGYRVRVLLEGGRVVTYFVDGESGAMQSAG